MFILPFSSFFTLYPVSGKYKLSNLISVLNGWPLPFVWSSNSLLWPACPQRSWLQPAAQTSCHTTFLFTLYPPIRCQIGLPLLQAHSHLQASALATPFAWEVLLPDLCIVGSCVVFRCQIEHHVPSGAFPGNHVETISAPSSSYTVALSYLFPLEHFS